LYADFPQALHLLGLCQWRQGQWNAAADALSRAAGLNPQDSQVLHDLGCVYSSQGRWVFAIRAYLQAIELRPGYADNYLNLGAAYESLSDYADAERAYRPALELNPRLATAAGSLAALCESGNRLKEAEQFVERALREDANDHVANLTQAQLDFRAGRHREALERLQALLQRPLAPRNRSLALARLGAIYEIFADYDRAFDAFQASKDALNVGDAESSGPGFYTLDTIQRISSYLPTLMSEVHMSVTALVETPFFLVGFPRSGTTLLDQILSSHSRLAVLEEKKTSVTCCGILLPRIQVLSGLPSWTRPHSPTTAGNTGHGWRNHCRSVIPGKYSWTSCRSTRFSCHSSCDCSPKHASFLKYVIHVTWCCRASCALLGLMKPC